MKEILETTNGTWHELENEVDANISEKNTGTAVYWL